MKQTGGNLQRVGSIIGVLDRGRADEYLTSIGYDTS
jgi:hypothetical protein